MTTALQALWVLPFIIPICLYVAFSDIRTMKIPNKAVYAMVAVFAVVGYIVFPFDVYLWRWAHLATVLIIGMVLNAARLMGAGDAKFVTAAAPLIAVSDTMFVMTLLLGCVIVGWTLHRLAKKSPLRAKFPDWKSWESGNRFPMGFPLAMTLVAYLTIQAMQTPGVA